MKMIQIEGIYQLTYMPRIFPVNCYLVEEQNSLTLVDTALPYSWSSILEAAASIGKPIRNIVLTHAHSDHIGSIDSLKERLPEAAIQISARDARLLAGDTSLEPDEPQSPIKGGVPKPMQVKVKPDILLQDGDRVGCLQVIAAPGHTPGSIALLDKRSGALIAGDAFQVRGGLAVSGQMKPLFPFPALATWNKLAALDSARKLLSLGPSLLAAGHGVMLRNPVMAMQAAVTAAKG